MINFTKQPGQRILELGGGFNRHPLSDVNTDVRSGPGVDFPTNLEEPDWKIQTEEFDGVLCIFCLEHCSYRKVPVFLSETLRVLKPGGWVKFVVPNTEQQLKWIQSHQEGWDGRSPFDSMSCILFGDQDYDSNAHKGFWSPTLATELFQKAGFTGIIITPYGERATDMMIEATKPQNQTPSTLPFKPLFPTLASEPPKPPDIKSEAITTKLPDKPASEIYNRDYFDNYQGRGAYWCYPENYIIAQKIIDRKPKSVLELGPGRGYTLKMIQDAGISVCGIDVSEHAYMTRVCDYIFEEDVLNVPWPTYKTNHFPVGLVYSVCLLEHIPEQHLPSFMGELKRVGSRGLHGITLEGPAPSPDSTRCTLKSLDFWNKILPEGHEAVDIRELTSGQLPKELYEPQPGRLCLNIGSGFTLFYGWLNIDTIDAGNFAGAFHYQYLRHDVRQGLNYPTASVDKIFSSNFLQCLTYEEALRFLRECRRVIRLDGAMRIVIPDCTDLANRYFEIDTLEELGEINKGCSQAPTRAMKLWSFLLEGSKSVWDELTIEHMLNDSGWNYHPASFRRTTIPSIESILRETMESPYGGTSLFCDCTPKVGK